MLNGYKNITGVFLTKSGWLMSPHSTICSKMETKLCRICGKLGENYVNIFRTEGLKNKIETCLPIIVASVSLLPDTICSECCDNIDNFYSFTKNCLQNIIILEAQFDIHESCLKTKRKHDKSCWTETDVLKQSQNTQTEDFLDVFLRDNEQYLNSNNKRLVDYDIDSDNSDCEESKFNKSSHITLLPQPSLLDSILIKNNSFGKKYFSDAENDLISEISQRKKRKHSSEFIETSCSKIFKLDTSSRRKSKQPKKVIERQQQPQQEVEIIQIDNNDSVHLEYPNEIQKQTEEKECSLILPQICLLCEEQFSGPSMLASHVFETHGIDMASIVALSTPNENDKKKKLPNLLKISDLRRNDSIDVDESPVVSEACEDPPTLLPSFVCSLCPAMFTARPILFEHLRIKHPDQSGLLCGMCLFQATTLVNLQSHLELCLLQHQLSTRYICQICRYGDDNSKSLENHVLVHTFLIEACKKQSKMFDPADYIELNENYDASAVVTKSLVCSECGYDGFESFKEFSTHRRSQHSIFHCDLCNKFYGRNSHLWKHVNRLHKGHPSITCQLCYKTSASKYHLAQHFNKIHSSKPCKQKNNDESSSNDFMSQKFQAFDFQSVKQSFMRQEMLEAKKITSEIDDNSNTRLSEEEKPDCKAELPKEIDSSSDLYTNIITNYTPPANEGEFKCPKCGKGFHKKTLLKKHKKNCRPRLQKDLLTRCKSCARIFKDRQSLAKHLVNYHSEYACEICHQKVQSKCEIVSHIRFSHPGCHLFCQMCGNILRCQQDLENHTRDHANSYVCQFCADPLPSKIKLKMHILSLHRKILSLSCGVCLKLFESQHVLRDHVRLVHRDQLAPLTSCPVCGKNYGSKWKTFDHLTKSHGRIFKACKACLEVFDTEEQLQVHYEQTHGGNFNTSTSGSKNNIVSVSVVQNNARNGESNEQQSESDNQASDDDYYDVKISLLEKRLLGSAAVKVEPSVAKQQLSVKKQLKREDMMENEASPALNSSKRTVYVNSNDPSFCEICHKTWPAKKHLWQHYIRCHKQVAATVCGICLKTNECYASLQEHLHSTHPTLLHGQGFGSNFICRICGRYHNASSKLRLHMAIHENFDWSLLEEQRQIKHESVCVDGDVKMEENGMFEGEDEEVEQNNDEEDEINYESLIEQVECSSGTDESDTETVIQTKEKESSSDEGEEEDDDEDGDDEDEGESEASEENCLETEMLKNMLRETQRMSNEPPVKEELVDDVRYEEVEDEDEDMDEDMDEEDGVLVDESSNSCFTVKSESNDEGEEECEGGNEEEDDEDAVVFQYKPEELDSAVQSIKYECVEDENEGAEEEYCELSSASTTLNENEIESAVGSIL